MTRRTVSTFRRGWLDFRPCKSCRAGARRACRNLDNEVTAPCPGRRKVDTTERASPKPKKASVPRPKPAWMATMDEIQQLHVARVLFAFDGAVNPTAEALEVSRETLYRWIRRWGWTVKDGKRQIPEGLRAVDAPDPQPSPSISS